MKLFFLFCFAGHLLFAQLPKVGSLEVFGNRKVSRDRIAKKLGLKGGDPLPPSKGDLEVKLEDLDEIARARIDGFCCEAGKAILYVGVEEPGGSAFKYRPEPGQELTLPEEIKEVYTAFTAALDQAARANDTAEDLSRGHSFMANVACQMQQQRMLPLAEQHEEILKQVLREAADPSERAIAAYVIGYVPNKKTVVDDLQLGLQDPDDAVRLNAVRALKAIAIYAEKEPGKEIRVQPTWFVEMLNSLSYTDRLEGAKALLNFTDKPNEYWLGVIRDRAVPALMETARWQYLPHALPAFLLLGRVAGWADQDLQDAWSRGEREKTIEAMRKSLKK